MDTITDLSEWENLNINDNVMSEKCIEISKAICLRKITLHEAVQNLEYFLTNTLADKREKGTYILSLILENLPSDYLSSIELQFLTSFFENRLKDNHQVIPAVLKGILVMAKMKNLPSESPCRLLKALFDNVPCQQQLMEDRQRIYEIFTIFLRTNLPEIQSMGMDFIFGVISAIEGERDPRNLLMVFKWLPELLKNVPLGHLNEEMFDVISCYFPVDFRPASQDPNQNVTREDLSEALCPCLCAVPEFAEFCIPLLLEKLSSSLQVAKLDSLKLLLQSCTKFDAFIYKQHSDEILSTLQNEILNGNDSELEEISLLVMTAVVKRLSESDNVAFNETLKNICNTLKENLKPDTKLFVPSTKLFLSIAKGTKGLCENIMQFTVPLIMSQYKSTSEMAHQVILFKTLMLFSLTYVEICDTKNITEINIFQDVPSLCLQNILHKDPEMRIVSLENISLLSKTLPLSVREHLYNLLEIKMIQDEAPPVRKVILQCYKILAQNYSSEILHKFIRSQKDYSNESLKLQLYLEAQCVIASEKEFMTEILPQLVNYCTRENISTAMVANKCLRNLLETNYHNIELQQFLFINCDIINISLRWILSAATRSQQDLELAMFKDIAVIMKLIIGHQNSNIQETIIKKSLPDLLDCWKTAGCSYIFVIIEGILSKLKTNVEIPDRYDMLCNIIFTTIGTERSVYMYICQFIANIINKWKEDDDLEKLLQEIDVYCTSVIKSNNNDEIQNIILLISWITKALVMKGSKQANSWTDKLIALLDISEDSALGFKLIMDDKNDCLNLDNYCNIRLLYKQNFFTYVTVKLSDNYKNSNSNYLVAVGYLLQLTPQQVIMMYFKQIFRLIIYCLEFCKNDDALHAVLDTLCTITNSREPYLESYIDDLLPRFLTLTKHESSMKVRIAAIKCIKNISFVYPLYKVLPHKQSIIFGLAPCLDDKKRLVRRQAVEARSRWILLDSPT